MNPMTAIARYVLLSLAENGHFGAAAGIQWLWKKLKPSKEASRYFFFLKQTSLIKRRVSSRPAESRKVFPCYLINRKTDRARLEWFDKSAVRIGLDYDRVEAVNALERNFDFTPYQKIIAKKFYGESLFPKGMIGCFLSHYKCWHMLRSSGADMGCIFEDDAQVLVSPQRSLDVRNIPPDTDVIFLNQRISEGFMDAETLAKIRNGGVFFADAFDAVKRTYQKGLSIDGVGTDGYLVTSKGANKLIEMFNEHKLYQCIDWEILINSFKGTEFEEFVTLHGNKHFTHIDCGIRSYVMIPSIVRQRDLGSILGMQNKNNLAEYDEMFGVKG
jgi:GR25 family glycosyltransferase involved in LPS biosynthesis